MKNELIIVDHIGWQSGSYEVYHVQNEDEITYESLLEKRPMFSALYYHINSTQVTESACLYDAIQYAKRITKKGDVALLDKQNEHFTLVYPEEINGYKCINTVMYRGGGAGIEDDPAVVEKSEFKYFNEEKESAFEAIYFKEPGMYRLINREGASFGMKDFESEKEFRDALLAELSKE